MKLEEFLLKLKSEPDTIDFSDTLAIIEENYYYTPTSFSNGGLSNRAGENEGSCKLFAFAQLQGFSQSQTLACFGAYYRDEVLNNLDGDSHQNIRNFIETGWEGIEFESNALVRK